MSTRMPSTSVRGAHRPGLQRGLIFGVIILTALVAFEAFNFSTTQYALRDMLGGLAFLGFSWASILAVAFCGIDFAGIARLFTPDEPGRETNEVWYLFGAWLLAATMNAMLTWWGITVALVENAASSSPVLEGSLMLRVVPIVIAVMVWLIRILIIGTFSMAGQRLFSAADGEDLLGPLPYSQPRPARTTSSLPSAAGYQPLPAQPAVRTAANHPPRSAPVQEPLPQRAPEPEEPPVPVELPEPVYQPMDGHTAPRRPTPATGRPVRR